MFRILKLIIWVVGLVVVTGFVLNYFGYEIHTKYFTERKADCRQKLDDCQKELIHQGLDNAECDFNCVNPKLIIRKK